MFRHVCFFRVGGLSSSAEGAFRFGALVIGVFVEDEV